jgi:hypothetical protein
MSNERNLFEAEVRKSQPNWEVAVDNLSALAMFEMLPTLAALQPATRTEVVNQARTILSSQRGWRGAFERIDFAADVINDRRLTSWPSDLPNDQVEDARNFLMDILRPATSQAGRAGFSTADAAGIAAVQEINSTSIAIKLEFSGSVFRLGSSFGFTQPRRGEPTSADPFVPVPAGATQIALYHTHGAGFQNSTAAESFSIEDREICKQLSKRFGRLIFNYLGTPNGRILKFEPRPNEPGMGNGTVVTLR